VLDVCAAAGGSRRELELDCGHTPRVEQTVAFNEALAAHSRSAGG
jgi:hypothetical protein